MDEQELRSLREAYAQLLEASETVVPPTDDELAALVSGELKGDERSRVVLHMLQSPTAVKKHRILQALHRQSTARRPPWLRGVWAAAAAAALAGTFIVWQSASMVEPPMGGGTPRTESVAAFPRSGATLEEPPELLRWPKRGVDVEYRVKIRDAKAAILWQSERTSAARLNIPPSVRQRMARGGTYLWTVEETSSRTPLFVLGPYSFRVMPPDTP